MAKEVDEEDILPCSKCKTVPRFYEVTGLWYIQCPGRCERMEVGVSKKRVIENWNEMNKKSVKYVNKIFRPAETCKDEYKGVGEGEPIYQLSPTGKTVKIFKSCHHLSNFLGVSKNSIVSKFYNCKTGYVTIKGIKYFREPKNAKSTDNTKTTPTTTRRGRPRKVQD
jgi:hypothetical protein